MKDKIEQFRETFSMMLPEINENTEKYRKGIMKIKVLKEDGTPVSAKIRVEQNSHAFDFGTSALMLGAMGDKEKEYRDTVSNLFNFVTTTFCWGVMETEPGKFRFEEGGEEIYRRPPSDRVLRFAQENNMKVKGQPLFCGHWCPKWLPQDLEVLKDRWLNYVDRVAERYDGKYHVFDVVNESYLTDATWKNMSWLPMPVGDFVKWLLKSAGERFSDKCIMERNEATHVNWGEYADIYYNENKRLLEEGVRLDSIGFQFHFFNGKDYIEDYLCGEADLKNIYRTYVKMSGLGVPLYITEITIPTVYEGMTLDEGEDLQAEILEKLYRLWFSVPGMNGIIYWNLKDGDTWVNESDCRGCLVDEYMRKKKSYYALEHLIKREWNTCVSSVSDENGKLEFSAFYGKYDIVIESDGNKVEKRAVSFDRKGQMLTITIP